ncbi:cytochrome c [Vibrio nitrifigilis]|uniref:Cytochrome c n=1 Tax=Vibrio nitrifigilis TaxID=2789781 RepID=A0ABS0GEL2_9VIBR|nr:cytochrome c [Vibrio nitrifigilis]MBF9000857.1 cytochrome c [Vibrio nitrifigilis]
MKTFTLLLLCAMGITTAASSVAADQSNLIQRGQYLATAGDCTACHTSNETKPYAGGYPFNMPMGKIISSNITSSKQFGIGNWTEQQFADAVRKGVRPDGSQLYPAMPYTSYSNITDQDMQALYAYFQSVPAIDEAPKQKTELSFPFNLPGLMWGWNLMFAHGTPFKPDDTLSVEQNRGKYLVEGLAHCSTCHTPRNQMMAEDSSEFLAGAHVDGWFAPNITSDKISGIGGWSDAELASYLKNGHAVGKAQAGGPMADAIQHSFRFMTDNDIHAIVSYLKSVPAHRITGQSDASWSVSKAKPVSWTKYEPGNSASNTKAYTDFSTTNGANLYSDNCAACHGANGEGSDDHTIPSLTNNTAVGGSDPTNLVMAITHGIHRQGADGKAVMPAFGEQQQVIHSWLTAGQIAAIANYVTDHFGQRNASLTAQQVTNIQQGSGDIPFLVQNAKAITIIAIVIVLVIIVVLVRKLKRNKEQNG